MSFAYTFYLMLHCSNFKGWERWHKTGIGTGPLIASCKMNDIDPRAWIADVLARLPDIAVSCLPELPSWNWNAAQEAISAA